MVGRGRPARVGWSQEKRVSGVWKLDGPILEDADHVWFSHDDGGRHGVIKVQLGAHLWR